MAQFDVFENASSRTAKQFPYLLEVQSNLFEDSDRSVYIPLVKSDTLKKPDEVLNPELIISGKTVRLFPLDISSAARSTMGVQVGNIRTESDSIVAAMDLLFARF